MPTFDLSPLFRSTIGFDRMSRLLDAAMRGTYVIEREQVTLTPDGEAMVQTLPLSADRTKAADRRRPGHAAALTPVTRKDFRV